MNSFQMQTAEIYMKDNFTCTNKNATNVLSIFSMFMGTIAFLPFMNKAAMNNSVCVFLRDALLILW